MEAKFNTPQRTIYDYPVQHRYEQGKKHPVQQMLENVSLEEGIP